MSEALALFDTAPDLRTDGGRARCPSCGTLTAAHDLAPAVTYDGPRVCRRCAAAGAQAVTLPLVAPAPEPDEDDQDPRDTLYPPDTDPDAWPVQPADDQVEPSDPRSWSHELLPGGCTAQADRMPLHRARAIIADVLDDRYRDGFDHGTAPASLYAYAAAELVTGRVDGPYRPECVTCSKPIAEFGAPGGGSHTDPTTGRRGIGCRACIIDAATPPAARGALF